MKHPNFITLDDATVEYSEVKPMIEALAKRLSEAGISATVSRNEDFSTGYAFEFKFASPIKGRDWKRSAINCTGFRVWVQKNIGKDEMRVNGHFVIEEDKSKREIICGKWPHIYKLEGERYEQFSAEFQFLGKERRYRCRHLESIQDNTMSVYQYDDDIGAIDFRDNIRYLEGIR